MSYFAGIYDVLVVGAGHAGIEASLAAARLGCQTAIFTINLDWVGNLPCNPSIGGTAKGHLVREIDALGGEMGRAADATFLQSRMLNRGKGPAVHSLRAQIDRRRYSDYMKRALERQENLELRQSEIISLRPLSPSEREGEAELAGWPSEQPCWRAVTRLGAVYYSKTVILATGTFLGGRIMWATFPTRAARTVPLRPPPWPLLSRSCLFRSAASKPALPPGSTAVPSIFPSWKSSRVMIR